MRNTGKLFAAGLRQIARDGMLLVLVPAPLFAGLFFRFAIPLIDRVLTERFSFSIAAWYGLIDGMLICLAPMFVAIISAFLILEERDEGLVLSTKSPPRRGIPTCWRASASRSGGRWGSPCWSPWPASSRPCPFKPFSKAQSSAA